MENQENGLLQKEPGMVGKFVKIGLSYVKKYIMYMETDTEDLSGSDSHECKLREFKLKARYLLFCISAKELLIK